jgi:tripartite-type tricarboxylate transporter receptor subunit TctC
MNRRNALRIGMLALAWHAADGTPAAAGDAYPSTPVKIISHAPAGNGPDVIARVVADRLSKLWGQQALIINRPGAGGLLAAQAAVAAEPDGYTLYQAITSSLLILPVTQPLPFDMQRDLVPIGFMGELFRARAGVDITLVPYPSTSQGLQDLMGGRISVIFESLAGLKGAVEAGSLKALAVTSTTRLPNLPDVPTVAEFVPGYAAGGWFVLMAPTHTPDTIVRKVNHDLAAVLAEPELKQRFETLGTYPRPMAPAETAAFIRAEQEVWQPLARKFIAAR